MTKIPYTFLNNKNLTLIWFFDSSHFVSGNQSLFEWHTDHYTLPGDAVQLASGKDYAHQAYRIGRATYATQFHFEVDRPLVDGWIASHAKADSEDWAPGHKTWLPKQFDEHLTASQEFCKKMTQRWLDLGR